MFRSLVEKIMVFIALLFGFVAFVTCGDSAHLGEELGQSQNMAQAGSNISETNNTVFINPEPKCGNIFFMQDVYDESDNPSGFSAIGQEKELSTTGINNAQKFMGGDSNEEFIAYGVDLSGSTKVIVETVYPDEQEVVALEGVGRFGEMVALRGDTIVITDPDSDVFFIKKFYQNNSEWVVEDTQLYGIKEEDLKFGGIPGKIVAVSGDGNHIIYSHKPRGSNSTNIYKLTRFPPGGFGYPQSIMETSDIVEEIAVNVDASMVAVTKQTSYGHNVASVFVPDIEQNKRFDRLQLHLDTQFRPDYTAEAKFGHNIEISKDGNIIAVASSDKNGTNQCIYTFVRIDRGFEQSSRICRTDSGWGNSMGLMEKNGDYYLIIAAPEACSFRIWKIPYKKMKLSGRIIDSIHLY